jgi:hypothetical protein
MHVFIPAVSVNIHGKTIIDYTNGAHQFLLKHNVQYLIQYDALIVVQPEYGIEIEAETLEELFALAEEYNATFTILPDGIIELEFID